MIRWLRSRLILAWALLRNLVLSPFIDKSLATWVGRLRGERLAPTPPGAWPLMAASSRCIACGLCDAVTPPEVHASRWILGACRQPADAPLARREALLLRRWAPAIAEVCPGRVDVVQVATLIELHAASLPEVDVGDNAPL